MTRRSAIKAISYVLPPQRRQRSGSTSLMRDSVASRLRRLRVAHHLDVVDQVFAVVGVGGLEQAFGLIDQGARLHHTAAVRQRATRSGPPSGALASPNFERMRLRAAPSLPSSKREIALSMLMAYSSPLIFSRAQTCRMPLMSSVRSANCLVCTPPQTRRRRRPVLINSRLTRSAFREGWLSMSLRKLESARGATKAARIHPPAGCPPATTARRSCAAARRDRSVPTDHAA